MRNLLALLTLMMLFTVSAWCYASSLRGANVDPPLSREPVSLADLINTIDKTSKRCAVRACQTP
jgi:hypothetical protein